MTISKRLLALLLPALWVAFPAVILAAGAKPEPTDDPLDMEAPRTPEEEAVDHFNFGLGYRDKAWKLEEKAQAASNEKERMKSESKAQKAWTNAIREFETATAKNASFYQAYGSLGYALRKTGDYRASLTAYDRALELDPHYAEAIEYRGEAYLGLDRVDDAKQAYMQLFSDNRGLADQLLDAMKAYIENRRSEGGGDAATLDALSEWVSERQEIAGQTASVSELRDRDW